MTTIPCPHCRTPLEIRTPEQVVAYLERTGWVEPAARSATFAAFRRGLQWLDVPVCGDYRDYPRRFLELLTSLSKLEQRPIPEILADMGAPSPHCSGCGVRLGDSWCAACASTAELERVRAALREALDGWTTALGLASDERRTPGERRDEARIAEWRKLVA